VKVENSDFLAPASQISGFAAFLFPFIENSKFVDFGKLVNNTSFLMSTPEALETVIVSLTVFWHFIDLIN